MYNVYIIYFFIMSSSCRQVKFAVWNAPNVLNERPR